ncbi:hypothetical protein PQR34_47120 [Paraburkholderia sediminicola]|uniref:hypothetical protein n=1 Tax=Paraburkholderia sediminicola TaxID=458836 RepID=UPI0038BC12F8
MSTVREPVRKAWATYLAAYAIFFAILIFPLLSSLELTVDVAAMVCLYCYVRKRLASTVWARLALTAIAFLFVARTAIFLHVKLSNPFPAEALGYGFLDSIGAAGVLFQVPMAAALFRYSLGGEPRFWCCSNISAWQPSL